MSNIQGEVLAEQPKANETETGEVEMQTEKVAVNAVESLQQQFHESYTDTFSSNAGSLQLDLIALIVLSVMFFSGILYFLKKKDSILRS